MRKAIASSLLFSAIAAGGCRPSVVDSDVERTAPPDQFVVTTKAGMRLTGPAARIDIRHAGPAGTPDVEVFFSASGGSGQTWSVQSVASPDFLETHSLTARVVDGLLGPGKASVQMRPATAESTAATAGLLSLRLSAGRLVGDTSRMSDELAAAFDGPFVVTCAVPASSAVAGAPAPAPNAQETRPTLIVDEKFESALCRPYAALGGWSR